MNDVRVLPPTTPPKGCCVSIVPNSHLLPKQMMWHARSAWWLETKSYARRKPRHCLAPLGNPKKKKCSLLFLIFAGVIFSKMERTFFFLEFCPPSIRAVWRGFNADSVLDFVREEEGSGEESARAFLFDF